ncbi:MAG: hypothetical protein ABIV63_08030 [Caldimonas sp.]
MNDFSLLRQPHPAPHRGRVGAFALWFPILAGPLVWSLQLFATFSLTAHACYPHDVPLDVPSWSGTRPVMTALVSAALLVAVASGWTAWRCFRSTREEKPGPAHRVLEGGDGRTRFIAVVGLMTSALFAVAVAFAAIDLVVLSGCGR